MFFVVVVVVGGIGVIEAVLVVGVFGLIYITDGAAVALLFFRSIMHFHAVRK